MHTRLSWRATIALSGLAALASLSVVGTGCAVLNELTGPAAVTQATQADVDAAVSAKDLAKLEQLCKGEGANQVSVMDAACTAGLNLLHEQGNYERLDNICRGLNGEFQKNDWRGQSHAACDMVSQRGSAVLLQASCDEFPSAYEKQAQSPTFLMKMDKKVFAKIGLRAAECNQWDFLIEKLMHLGESGGIGEVMTRAVFEKYPQFEDKVLAYMKAHMDNPGGFEHADYAFDHYTTILNERHLFKKCAAYFPYADKAPDQTFGMFNWYFRKAKCKGAAKLAVKRLASDRASTRQGACKTLALLGSKHKYLKKLKMLANHDPFFIIHKDTIPAWKEYAVRDTCAKAANQLSLK